MSHDELDYAYFGDGSHILYVNGTFREQSHPIGRLMHDFHCKNVEDMMYPVLADRVRYFKESEGGCAKMSQIVEALMKKMQRNLPPGKQHKNILSRHGHTYIVPVACSIVDFLSHVQ